MSIRARKHVLIVEDEKHLAMGVKYNLEAEGYRVTWVEDGPTAVRLIEADHYAFDMMILDLMLPGMSGYAVCQTLRDQGIFLPILILSARSLPEDRARGFDCGANQYLNKPFDLDELLARVKNLLICIPRYSQRRSLPLLKSTKLTSEELPSTLRLTKFAWRIVK